MTLRERLTQFVMNSRVGRRISVGIFQPRGIESGEVILKQRRVFILPTRAGFTLAFTLVALLLGSINYSLSLGFVLTFAIAGIAWVGMFFTFRNLLHLGLRGSRVEPIFAGEVAQFHIVLANRKQFDRFALSIQSDPALAPVGADPAAQAESIALIPVKIEQRGWQPMPRATIQTNFPLGLWRAWSYWQPDLNVLVYPAPAPPDMPLPPAQSDGASGDGHAGPGSEDFAGIRPYTAGDVLKHLAWKAMARTADDAPLTKIFDGGQQTELWLDLASVPTRLGVENALSRLTRWVLECEASDIRYGLRLPGSSIDPDHGDAHRSACLTALALYQGR